MLGVICLFLMMACKQVPTKLGVSDTDSVAVMPLEYAQGFQVKTLENGVKLVDVAKLSTLNCQLSMIKFPKVTRRWKCLWSGRL